MTERVWTNPDPLGTPDGWTPCGVVAGSFNTVAGGYGGEFVVAGSTIEKTDDNTSFANLGSGPSTVNHMLWRGLPGMYALALDDGFYTTIDFGDTLGPMRPNAGFGTTWPGGAIGYQVAVSYGARTCPAPSVGNCDDAPRYEAAVGMEVVNANYLTNGQLLSDSILGASIDVSDTSLVTTYYEGTAHHKSLGHESGSGTTLVISITPTIIDSFIFLAVASRPGTAPTSVTDSQSLTWDLIQTELSSDSVGAIRLSIYRTNANAASVLGLDVTVTFPGAQDIILAIADEWIGLSAAVGTDPVVDSDVQHNYTVSPSNYPDQYLLSYTFSSPYAFEEAIPAPVSFGIAVQLELCTIGCITSIEQCVPFTPGPTVDISTNTATISCTVQQAQDSFFLVSLASHQGAGSPSLPSISDNTGIVWELVDSVVYGTNNRITAWVGQATAQAISDMAFDVTVLFAGAQDGMVFNCDQLVGALANPVVQSATTDNVGQTNPFAVTLPDAPSASNFVWSAAAAYDTGNDLGNDVFYIEEHDIFAVPNTCMAVTTGQLAPGDGGLPALSWAYSGGLPSGAIGIEIGGC